MKKMISTLFVIFGMAFFTQNLGAADCQGNGYMHYWMSWEEDAIIADADMNCCAGSQIGLFDLSTNEYTTYIVLVDGPNSSCAQQ